MELTFLCTNHKRLFREQPEHALTCCLNTIDKWRMLFNKECWNESLPYIGCAWEASQIMVMSRSLETASAVEWLMYTFGGLTENLKKTSRADLCIQACQMTIGKLKEKSNQDLTAETLTAPRIAQLTEELNRLEASFEWSRDTYSQRIFASPTQNDGKPVLH